MRKLIGILSVVLVLLVGVGVLLYSGVLEPKDAAPAAPETALAASTAPSTEPETEPPTTTEPQPELSARDEAVIFDGVELETYDCEGETVVRATDFLAASGADDGGAASESGAPAIAVSEDGSSVTVGQRTFRTVVDGEVYLPLDQVVSTLGYPTWVDDEDGTTYITRSFEITPDVNVPILEYHAVGDDCWGYEELFARPDRLEELFGFLNDNGYDPIWFEDLAHLQDYDKPVMLTFDDGYYNNYVYAYPLLRQRGMRAVVSIIGSQTALFTENGEENAYWSHLRAERLRETEDVFEIQNHSWNLHEYGERRGCLRRSGEDEAHYAKLLHEDTEQTQQLIEEIGLPAPECYTYPFGACSEESERILREMGFLCTLGCEERINTVTRDPESLYQLGRFNRAAFESTDDFLRRALGE